MRLRSRISNRRNRRVAKGNSVAVPPQASEEVTDGPSSSHAVLKRVTLVTQANRLLVSRDRPVAECLPPLTSHGSEASEGGGPIDQGSGLRQEAARVRRRPHRDVVLLLRSALGPGGQRADTNPATVGVFPTLEQKHLHMTVVRLLTDEIAPPRKHPGFFDYPLRTRRPCPGAMGGRVQGGLRNDLGGRKGEDDDKQQVADTIKQAEEEEANA